MGAGLIGFYQLHLLTFISPEFFIVPLVLLGKLIFDKFSISQEFLKPNVIFVNPERTIDNCRMLGYTLNYFFTSITAF